MLIKNLCKIFHGNYAPTTFKPNRQKTLKRSMTQLAIKTKHCKVKNNNIQQCIINIS